MSCSDWIRHIGSWFSDLIYLGENKCVYGPPERFKSQNDDEDMLNLAKVAYERGEHSMNYYEKDMDMFKFLQYYQNKKLGKTLRLFKGMLFFYSMEPPHELVTCFPYENNYHMYLENKKDKKLKRWRSFNIVNLIFNSSFKFRELFF